MTTRRMRTVRILAAGWATLALGSCATPKSGSTTGATSSTVPTASTREVSASLSEWKVELAQTTLTSGSYMFTIHNAGKQEHELIAFKTDLAATALPMNASGGVNEEASGLTKTTDGDNIKVGQSQSRVVDLTSPGKYVFVCNLPGHYKLGMYLTVTVTSS